METNTYYDGAEYYEDLPKAHGGMVLSAIGATLAMLPLPLIFVLSSLEIVRYVSNDVSMLLSISMVVGILLWGIGQMSCIRAMRSNGLGWAPVLVGIFLFVYIFAALIFCLIENGEIAEEIIGSILYGHIKGLVFVGILLFVGIHVVMVIGTGAYSRVISGMLLAKIGYWLILIIPIALVILAAILMKDSSYYYYYSEPSSVRTFRTIAKILFVVLMVADVLCVIGWWIGAGAGIPVDQEYLVAVSQSRVATQPVQDAGTPVVAYAPAASVASVPKSKISPQLQEKLMTMDDARLQEIADNPDLYANKAYVEAAVTVLKKRRAWEMINAKSDDELLEIVKDEDNIHEFVVRDAASMELFSRQSPGFVAMFDNESVESIRNIVNNPDNYFDGYVSMARQLLEQKA